MTNFIVAVAAGFVGGVAASAAVFQAIRWLKAKKVAAAALLAKVQAAVK